MKELIKLKRGKMKEYIQTPHDEDRLKPEIEKPLISADGIFTRTQFSRDRDRIKFSRAFRRLEHKAQIYSHEKGDHFRTRLTHTLAVSQISRSLAKNLGLDEELVDAITLGHDIGHTPFGHQGERTLDDIMSGKDDLSGKIKYKVNYGGFKHNFHSLKVLDELEVKHRYHKGLNLTWQVMEGILKHTKVRRHKAHECTNCGGCWDIKRFINDENFLKEYMKYDFSVTLEGQIVAIADEIAQRQHDIDDGLMDRDLGITLNDICKYLMAELRKITYQIEAFHMNSIMDKYSTFYLNNLKYLMEGIEYIDMDIGIERENLYKIGTLSTRVLNFFIQDVTINSLKNISNIREEDVDKRDNKLIIQKKVVVFSFVGKKVNDIIETYIKRKILNSYNVNRFDAKAVFIIKQLFKAYYSNPRQMPEYILERLLNRVKPILDDIYDIEFVDGEKLRDINFVDSKPNEVIKLVNLMKLQIDFKELELPEGFNINELKKRGYIKEDGSLNEFNLTKMAKDSYNDDYDNIESMLKALVEIQYAYLSVICDYVAGMTDNFACKEYKNLYLVI
ncbi:dGTP triphosphohydrolase [Clostridium botulinum]|uniref:Deoxyguanosinetriphosphate triphosphohydrolase n=1 Tax=Clostridium botulinum C/D str. DC5 TaxID=1443128 RepID=A0A0A0IJB8_CLOBO|nr:dNTP triphosphohydrolase [Clostridium botulinum]KGM99645.1 deoxyguanosinetriphosphate triphosphohydrolase [Clostridium botulinum C/D str. DC5]MCD3240491.1 dNTP triphosphohydrolase [Clostridium botulinum D/C]MCD3330493.1 dNTP triphosphohydrolase [Clostridium botulinum D/C]MCD3333705.1 dNTP triphosphohydrolase [Clostridium botulinum D/C]MCD3342540.1 dNTP triphosphohydrolase [Clostridium botulinum D/C]